MPEHGLAVTPVAHDRQGGPGRDWLAERRLPGGGREAGGKEEHRIEAIAGVQVAAGAEADRLSFERGDHGFMAVVDYAPVELVRLPGLREDDREGRRGRGEAEIAEQVQVGLRRGHGVGPCHDPRVTAHHLPGSHLAVNQRDLGVLAQAQHAAGADPGRAGGHDSRASGER